MQSALLRCSGCGQMTLAWDNRPAKSLSCRTCGREHPIKDGVIDLLDEPPQKRSLAQAAMESTAIVNIYESRFWRKSPFFTLLTGIPFDRECARIVSAAHVGPNSCILDVACGPGIYTRPLARMARNGLVVGLDLSLPMLGRAKILALRESIENIVFVRASALDLPFDDSVFDVVNCCGALHLFPDPAKALASMNRVLAPGGSLMLGAVKSVSGKIEPSYRFIMERLAGIRPFGEAELEKMLKDAG
ncbi:MAG: class I SAM-dependent methyltransferase, partial [Desulfatibacillaceae bacterium]|nr:class I SAM-dependent methyltransferase [Desulfatibacillaceae bacterium]